MQKSDFGNYECTAKNKTGEIKCHFNVLEEGMLKLTCFIKIVDFAWEMYKD